MTVRKKAVLILAGLLAALYGTLYLTANLVLLRSYQAVESQRASEEAQRAVDTVESELSFLDGTVKDWSSWTDTYAFMQTRDPAYTRDNLDGTALSNLNIEVLLYLDVQGRPVFAAEQKPGQRIHHKMLKEETKTLVSTCLPDDIEKPSSGVIYLHGVPVLVVTRPIWRNDSTGPSRGTLIMARYVDGRKLHRLSDMLRLDVAIHRLDASWRAELERRSGGRATSSPLWTSVLSSESIGGYAVLRGPKSDPVAIIETASPRSITKQGRETLSRFLVAFLAAGLVLGLAVLLLLDRGILARLKTLDRDLQLVGTAPDSSARVHVDADPGKADELTRVALTVNSVLTSLELARQSFAKAFELNPNLMAITRISDGACVEVNQAFLEKTGYTREEVIGHTSGDLRLYEDSELAKGITALVREHGEVRNQEINIRRKSGARLVGLCSAQTMDVSSAERVLSVIGDITELKAIEQELREAKEAALAATAAKSVFLANMSHEIRTPLNGVIGSTGLLLRTQLDERQRRYCNTITFSGEILLNLINDILDFSKIESGRMELDDSEFGLVDTIEDLADTFSLHAAEKGVELVNRIAADLPLRIRGDQTRLRQVLINLIGNAVKFTESGEIVIDCSAETKGEDQTTLKCSVSDTGIGISPEQQSRLFESFSQVDASITRNYGGTGLGLAISKSLVEMMGGEIWVESEARKGSKFLFTVPLGAVAGSASARSGDMRSACSNMRVLAVDDNQVNREVISEMLTSWAIEHETACDAAEAMKHLMRAVKEERPFGLVLLDYQMAQVDGLGLARIIRTTPDVSQVPIVMLTSSDLTREEYEAPDVRVSKCLSKPIRQSSLLDAIMETARGLPDSPTRRLADSQTRRPADSPAGVCHAGARILLAEDNEVNQMVVEEMVRMAGASCEIAANGQQAVNALIDRDFDLVLMDCQMPDVDGYEATGVIRTMEALLQDSRHIPIIALTANALAGDRQACLAAGMDDYLAKPIMPDTLFAMLDKWLPDTSGRTEAAPAPTALAEPSALEQRAEPAAEPVEEPAAQGPEHSSTEDATDGLPLDLDGLLARCGGSKLLAMKLLDKFCTRTPDELVELEETLTAGDAAELASLAHRLKGASATLSAESLRAEAADLERLAKEQNLPDAAQCVEGVKREFARLKDYLTNEMDAAA